ncbi:MAG: Na+/H+ antiporter subunit E [Lachnospiraceae bacterium]|nr:Na+/H+ antiporter subunit E [Lachnospiraceae bacterium]
MLFLLFALWLVFNGKVTLEIVLFGMVLSTAVYLFCWKFLEYSPKRELCALRLLPQGIGYFFVLVWEIVKANCAAIALIVSPKYEVEPVLVTFRTNLKTDLAKTILANSITLTPGTITVELTDDEFKVHCLDKEMAEGLSDSVFVRLLMKMEKTAER